MLTAPLTTSHFRNRVFDLFENLNEEAALTVSPLTKLDTDLGPGDLTSQLLAVASPWIDLASPDPLVYNISRQVLHLEVAYAAFCGVANIIVPGPNIFGRTLHVDGVAQYAYAIQEILETGIYHHVLIRLPMSDDSNRPSFHSLKTLASYTRPTFVGKADDEDDVRRDSFGMWDAWNVIRSICKYNNRLFVGKTKQNVSHSLYDLYFNSCFPIFNFRPHVQSTRVWKSRAGNCVNQDAVTQCSCNFMSSKHLEQHRLTIA